MSGTSVAVFGGCSNTVPPADSVCVGVAVGGHDRTVPRGGHGESGEYQENTLAAPCTLVVSRSQTLSQGKGGGGKGGRESGKVLYIELSQRLV